MVLLHCRECDKMILAQRRPLWRAKGCRRCAGAAWYVVDGATIEQLRGLVLSEAEAARVPQDVIARRFESFERAERRLLEHQELRMAAQVWLENHPTKSKLWGKPRYYALQTRLRFLRRRRSRQLLQHRQWRRDKRRAAAALQRVADEIDGLAYTRGVRRASHWAPDRAFPDRRLGDRMERDRPKAGGTPRGHFKKRVAGAPTRAEAKDPTCGGFFKDPAGVPRKAFAHVRRAQARIDRAKQEQLELEARRRAGVRRRPRGEAA